MIPCWWGVALNAPPLPFWDFFLFAIGALSMRSAGCVINDLTDRDFDKAVERTRTRPLVTGAVTRNQAILCFFGLCFVGLSIFYFLTSRAKTVSLFAFCLLLIYPWMKRVTHWPQLILGMAFNSGVLIAWAHGGGSFYTFLPWIFFSVGILWTLIYDTIYAFQDIQDDLKIGVKSTAILFQKSPKSLPSVCLILMSIVLISTGMTEEWSNFYFIIIGCAISYGVYLLKTWNPNSCSSSLKCFKSNQWVGWILFLALLMKSF